MTTNCVAVECDSIIRGGGDALCGPILACTAGYTYEFLSPMGWWPWGEEGVFKRASGTLIAKPALSVYCHQDMNGVQSWYAFPNRMARALHQELMKVEGVGAKGALMMMAKNTPEEIFTLLDNGDREAFARLKGMAGKVGAKVIEHLFKDRPVIKKAEKLDGDAVAALVALGYKTVQAKELVGKAMQALPGATTEAIIAAALKK